MLQELHPNELWAITDPMPVAGLQLSARIVIARLRDDSLFVHAPFAISDEDEAAIRALGEVKQIVVPNNFHYTQVADFCRRFPDVPVWAPPSLLRKFAQLNPQSLENIPVAWLTDFEVAALQTPFYQEWVFCHRASRTLIVTDLGMNIPKPRSPLARIAARVLGVGRGFRPTRFEGAMLMLGGHAGLRATLQTILKWDFERVVMAHGSIIEKDGRRQLRRSFAPTLR